MLPALGVGGVEELGLVKNLAPELCSVAVKEFVKQHSCGGGVGYRRVSVRIGQADKFKQ